VAVGTTDNLLGTTVFSWWILSHEPLADAVKESDRKNPFLRLLSDRVPARERALFDDS
jgi:hypothetical protein